MPYGTGLSAQLGWAVESTYGTFAVPTKFAEFTTESLALTIDRIESAALRAGNRVLRTDRWAANKKGAAGGVELEFQTKGLGLLLKHALGSSTITTPPSGVLTRLHTYKMADLVGSFLTIQLGRPDTTGVVRPFAYTGSKIIEWELANAVDGMLMLRLTIDAQDEDTTDTLAVASFPTAVELLNFTGGSVTIGGTAATVRDITIHGVNTSDTARYFLRTDTRKKEPLLNGMAVITGTIDMEFESLVAYQRFVTGTPAAVVAVWTGKTAIETVGPTYYPQLTATLNNVRFDGTTPNIGDAGIVAQALPFTVVWDGTAEPVQLDWQTTDVTD